MALKESQLDRISRMLAAIPVEDEDVCDETCELADAGDSYGFEVFDVLMILRKIEASWCGGSKCCLPLFKDANGRVYAKPQIEGKTVKVFLTESMEA